MTDQSVYYPHESSNDVEVGSCSERDVAKTAFAALAGTDPSLVDAAEDSHHAFTRSTTTTSTKTPLSPPQILATGRLALTSFFSSIMNERINSITNSTTGDEETDTEINFTEKTQGALFKQSNASSNPPTQSRASMSPNDVRGAGAFTDLEAGNRKMSGANDGLLESESNSHDRRSRKVSQKFFKSQNYCAAEEDSDDDDLDQDQDHHRRHYPGGDVEEDDDDFSMSSFDSHEGGGIIAIGRPIAQKKGPPAAITPPVAVVPTKEDATQQVLSEVVAQNLAEEEHNLKTGEKASPRMTVAGKRRPSTRITPPVTPSNSSPDELLSLFSTSSSVRLAREPGSTAGTATASNMNMNERRLARAAARASRDSSSTKSDDKKKGSKAGAYSSDESVKRRIPIVRSRKTFESTRSFDSASSGDSAYTFATESVKVRASRRTRDESIKMKEQEQQDSGPSLAPASSFERQDTLPGAFASVRQNRNAKEDTGPSLAPAVAPGTSKPSTSVASGPMLSAPTPMALYAAFVDEHEEDEIEAQAGIPVAYPGAFAIEGLDSGSRHSGYDSGAETSDLSSIGENQYDDADITEVDTEEQAAYVEIIALEAQLHERVVVDGAIIVIDPDEDDLFADPKVVRRFRMIQGAVLCFTIAAVAMVTGSVVGGFSTGSRPNDNNIPATLDGWLQVGSVLQGPTENSKVNFGTSVAISGDGEWIAITAPGVDDQSVTPNEVNVGQVRILQVGLGTNGTEWFPRGSLKGPGPSREEKTSLAMSSDGKRLAVGYYESKGGVVQLFERDDERNTFSDTVATEFVGDVDAWHGHSVDLSSDGTILAIGAPRINTANGIRSGAVRIFQKIDSNWTQLGNDIEGKADNEFFGWSVSLRATDGLRVAVGSPDVIYGGGSVRVYDWSSGEFWEEQAFPDISETSFGLLGNSIALSSSGSILAVGSRGTFGLGRVQVFRELAGVGWIEDDGTGLVGEQDSDSFGDSVSLSSDGSILAIGAPQNSEFGDGSGMVRVLKYDVRSFTWIQQGTDIGGSSPDVNLGVWVDLSADGSRVVAGAPKALFNGALTEAGSALVYDRDETVRNGTASLFQNE
jgi:hypothetical protein